MGAIKFTLNMPITSE